MVTRNSETTDLANGVMIVAGDLTEKNAQNKPLGRTAQLVFEQSYSGVEGDSAPFLDASAANRMLQDLRPSSWRGH